MKSCSFCGKEEHQVVRLVSGPAVHICNECVAASQDIIQQGGPPDTQPAPARESTPPCSRCAGEAGHRPDCPHVVGPFKVCPPCEGQGGLGAGVMRFACATCGGSGKVLDEPMAKTG